MAINEVMKKINDAIGDFSVLSNEERNIFVEHICETYGLDKSSVPVRFVTDNKSKKVIPYLARTATDQLRMNLNISVVEQNVQFSPNGIACIVTVKVQDDKGRTDMDVGSVFLGNATGDDYAKQIMACVTKAKRRATISLSGIGILDEAEIMSMTSEEVLAKSKELELDFDLISQSTNDELKEISEANKELIKKVFDNAESNGTMNTSLEYLKQKFKKDNSVLNYIESEFNRRQGLNDLEPFKDIFLEHDNSKIVVMESGFEKQDISMEISSSEIDVEFSLSPTTLSR